jgi:hypothetical protein
MNSQTRKIHLGALIRAAALGFCRQVTQLTANRPRVLILIEIADATVDSRWLHASFASPAGVQRCRARLEAALSPPLILAL